MWKSFIHLHCDNSLGSILFLFRIQWAFTVSQIEWNQTFRHWVCLQPSLLELMLGLTFRDSGAACWGWGFSVGVFEHPVLCFRPWLYVRSWVPPRAAVSDRRYSTPPLLYWCLCFYQIFIKSFFFNEHNHIFMVFRCILLFYFLM